ncbi:hypothetical protein ACNKHV_05095 [Shigella flexneri]
MRGHAQAATILFARAAFVRPEPGVQGVAGVAAPCASRQWQHVGGNM